MRADAVVAEDFIGRGIIGAKGGSDTGTPTSLSIAGMNEDGIRGRGKE